MAVPLLTTKLYIPPPRPNLIPRVRLVERLNEGLRLGRQLTLVSAPAGFGKTTLLGEWIHGDAFRNSNFETRERIAWLSLDEGDNDPIRFVAYLIGALQQVNNQVGSSVQGLLGSPQLPASGTTPDQETWIEGLMTLLLNDVTALSAPATPAGRPHILVLDDYHLIHASSVHDALRFLLEHLPSHLHLVISTREDPPLPLPRLRARGQLTEIRESDLRFSAEEATAFLNQTMGLQLSPEAVAVLGARTEGWIAGLQLAALSLQDRENADAFVATFAGDDRYVMDYLVDEVLQRQPEKVQSFLLRTSILNRLSGPLCDAVLDWEAGSEGSKEWDLQHPLSKLYVASCSQTILEYLDHSNLFLVPLDNRREWYRYHGLFADLLRYRLRHGWPDELAELHRRASNWYEKAGDADEAVYHAMEIPDQELVAYVAEQYGVRMVGSSRIDTYLNWIQRIPDDLISTHPYLCAACGWAYVLSGQVEEAERYVQAGEVALAGFEGVYVGPEDRLVGRDEVRGHLTAIRAYSARLCGDLAGVMTYSQQALSELPADAFTVRCVVALNLGLLYFESGELEASRSAFVEAFDMAEKSEENTYVAISALSLQGDILLSQGNLEEAMARYRQAIQLGEQAGAAVPIPAVGIGYVGLARTHYQRYELEAAAETLQKAVALVKHVANREALSEIYLFQAQLAAIHGDLAQVERLLDQVAKLAQDYKSSPHHDTRWAIVRGETYLAQGNVSAAAECAAMCAPLSEETIAQIPPPKELRLRLPDYLLLARVLLAQEKLDQALRLLAWLEEAAEACAYGGVLIEALVLLALAWQYKGDEIQALLSLQRALSRAMPQSYLRPFVAAGEPMRRLLHQAATRGSSPDDVGKLLATLGEAAARAAGLPREAAPSPLMEPLSERELEVLQLIAAGLSNREIAEHLVVAESTVKSHANHIYGKLGVGNRTQAVARARELGLL